MASVDPLGLFESCTPTQGTVYVPGGANADGTTNCPLIMCPAGLGWGVISTSSGSTWVCGSGSMIDASVISEIYNQIATEALFISSYPSPIRPSNNATTCQLVSPGGSYNVGPNAVALFQPQMANDLTSAFNYLNSQGITPTINSGYRSPADQLRMRNGASGPNPAAVVSWHQVGMAVDINGTTSSYFPTIINAMQAQGLTWGGNFTHPDPPHFQLAPPGTRPSAAMVSACAAAAGGHQ